jgi:hypothetical protein
MPKSTSRSKSKNLPRAHPKKKAPAPVKALTKCPKCGGQMINGACVKCKYSPKTAYRSIAEAKEFTTAGD